MLNNTSNDTTRDNTAGLSARAVWLARRNMCDSTYEDSSGHAPTTSPASPPSATTPSPPSASTPSPVASSSPIIRPELTSHSHTVPPTVVGFKSNDECIQERYRSAIENGDVIVLEDSPVDATAVVAELQDKVKRLQDKVKRWDRDVLNSKKELERLVVENKEGLERAIEMLNTAEDDEITHSDIGTKYDPITKEEVYEWNGVWYLVDGSGPAGQRWKGQGHGSDWRPNSEEEEEYEVWYKKYTANVLTRL